jgi:hypothetical protein
MENDLEEAIRVNKAVDLFAAWASTTNLWVNWGAKASGSQ